MKKGFTLIELVVAVALLVIVLTFAGLIFKVSVGSYRLAEANAEVMRNFRAITEQLNTDFAGFQKDGFLTIASRRINNVRSDRIFYYCTGDFQSWFTPNGNDYPRSNIAQICWGHDGRIFRADMGPLPPVKNWQLLREVNLLTPDPDQQIDTDLLPPTIMKLLDCNDITLSELKAQNGMVNKVFENLFAYPGIIDTEHPDNTRKLLCQNIGQLQIQWTDGTTYLVYDPVTDTNYRHLAWFGLDRRRSIGDPQLGIAPKTGYSEMASQAGQYVIRWGISTNRSLLPRAIKFTFRLYDSRGTIKDGRQLTHIVYIDQLEGK